LSFARLLLTVLDKSRKSGIIDNYY
jgi:hypothetical protein